MTAELSWEQVKEIADRAVFSSTGKYLSDREASVLHGAWQGLTYEAIAAQMNFSVDYIHKDIGSELWRKLSIALQIKVSKQNFRQALQHYNKTAKDSSDRGKFPTGTVAADSPFYLIRNSIESECERELANPGALVRIRAPQMMGKTSLLNWLTVKLQQQGCRTVRIGLRSTDKKNFQDIDRLLRWLCANISKQLDLPSQLDEYWDLDIGSKVSCTSYLQDWILQQSSHNLLIAIDDIDTIFSYPDLAEDFLSLLREWHEESNFNDVWQKLRLAIAHSTEVYLALDLDRSPFNVGLPVQLPTFDRQHAIELAGLYGVQNLDLTAIDRLLAFIGGHPHLLQIALYYLSQEGYSLNDFFDRAIDFDSIYRSHLKHYLADLHQRPQSIALLQQIVDSPVPIQIPWSQLYQLDSMGLIKVTNNLVSPSCELYRRYFQTYLSRSIDSYKIE